MLLHQANRPFSNFGRKSPLSGVCHRLGLSSVEVSDKPGAVLDMPGAADQIAFDRKLVAAGIAVEEGRGPRYAELNELLRQRRTKAGSIS